MHRLSSRRGNWVAWALVLTMLMSLVPFTAAQEASPEVIETPVETDPPATEAQAATEPPVIETPAATTETESVFDAAALDTLTINGNSSFSVTITTADNVTFATSAPRIGFFANNNCTGWRGGATFSPFATDGAFIRASYGSPIYVAGTDVSDDPTTTCRTLIINVAPPTATNTVAPTNTATATATTAAPVITINGMQNQSVVVTAPTPVTISASTGLFQVFYGAGCSSYYGFVDQDSMPFVQSADNVTNLFGGAISVRGATAGGDGQGTFTTDCYTASVVQPTATATTPATQTLVPTNTSTATSTTAPTATATATPASLLTVNGFPNDVVHVWMNGTVTIVWQNIPYLVSYRSANCTGSGSLIGSSSGASSDSGTNWQIWAGAPVFSILGQTTSSAGGPAVTTCRTIYLDTDPPTATPTPLLTINGSTANSQHVALSSQVNIVATGIRTVSFYFGTGCTGTNYFNGTDLNGTGHFYSIPATNWAQYGGDRKSVV